MWMHCGENVNSIIFGGGQRSSWVNVGQTLKSLLTHISRMCYGEKMDPIVFGEGQRSSGVTRGKKAKFPKNSQEFYMGSAEVKEQNFPRFPKIVISGHQRSNCKFPKNSQN
ncbi:hypothetical protein HOLleu_19755 [Holothuria leucospilota]|uniref:Uncharacterized protein n=1 Tax=Holothuria leucospilota TaxID=206669 RepID=A0A9Q1C0J6_HOLLE|nr:hypothetical protein HOLleu_19755 [Holothuria leucospilota]